MNPPSWLPQESRGHFRRLAKLLQAEGRASPSHVDVVALLAVRLSEIEGLNAALEGGSTYETTTDRSEAPLVRARPEASQRDAALRHAHSLLVELGLTPAAAHRMLRDIAAEREKEENPFEEFA